MLHKKLLTHFPLHNGLSIFSSFLSHYPLPLPFIISFSLALLTVAHSLTVDLLVLMKWVCYKIIYFMLASFFEFKIHLETYKLKI